MSDRIVLGRYFLLAGAFRFGLEFLRVNTRVLGPLTVAHMFAIAVVVLGVALLVSAANQPRARSGAPGSPRATV